MTELVIVERYLKPRIFLTNKEGYCHQEKFRSKLEVQERQKKVDIENVKQLFIHMCVLDKILPCFELISFHTSHRFIVFPYFSFSVLPHLFERDVV